MEVKMIPNQSPKAKNPHAVALGRKGGKASSRALTPEARVERAKKAIQARWSKRNPTEETAQ